MDLEERWLSLVSGETGGCGAAAERAALEALSGLYWLGLRANLALYDLGLCQHTQATLPVISVGNLTVGGTGKSTAVRFLARELLALGVRPGVVLRGHRRQGGAEELLASDGRGSLATLDECGDEALEVARALLEVPVAVGKRRERVIELLTGQGAQLALLDDGYQYFRMGRNLNLALVSARLNLRSARLLPRGVLREPWSHLRRADQVWLTHCDLASAQQVAAITQLVRRHTATAPLVLTRHRPQTLVNLRDGARRPLTDLQGRAVVALSGLGCPESFEGTLAALGASVVPVRFPDHHPYGPADWDRVAQAARTLGDLLVVTTEKDAVKLPSGEPLPVWVLRSELEILDNAEAVAEALGSMKKTVDA
ncbi:MAG: tetraacyldisaccharide 4'-kinase [Armatimonadota bacterium]